MSQARPLPSQVVGLPLHLPPFAQKGHRPTPSPPGGVPIGLCAGRLHQPAPALRHAHWEHPAAPGEQGGHSGAALPGQSRNKSRSTPCSFCSYNCSIFLMANSISVAICLELLLVGSFLSFGFQSIWCFEHGLDDWFVVMPCHQDVKTPEFQTTKDPQIHMDCMAFGMGCCCLQVRILHESLSFFSCPFIFFLLTPTALTVGSHLGTSRKESPLSDMSLDTASGDLR